MGNIAAVKNGTLLHPAARTDILRRIEALTPETEHRWGRMTAHQMVCHLSRGLGRAPGPGHWYALGAHGDQVACDTHERNMAARRADSAGGRPGIHGHPSNGIRAGRR